MDLSLSNIKTGEKNHEPVYSYFTMRMLPFLLFGVLCASEVVVDLRNPTYKNGVLFTNEGGLIRNEEIRIQAQEIQYFHREGEERIEASGDLMIQYKGKVFVGEALEYDFNTRTGVIYEGKTAVSIWYIGGDEIQLNDDGSFEVTRAFITTCENKCSSWDLRAECVRVVKDQLLEARQLHARFYNLPTVWLPSFKVNLYKFDEPIFDYYARWDSGVGPKAGIRYQFYSWRDWALFARVEYRLRKGWGGAFETEYFPDHKRTTFVTRSYLGKDTLDNAPNPALRRYRLEGVLISATESDRTHVTLTWDKYSDVRMPQDFRNDDFEMNHAHRTLFYLHHREDNWIGALKFRPRVNPFESVKQDLPTLFLSARPYQFAGIYGTSFVKASYLDFAYSDQLTHSIPDFHSIRAEARQTFQRPIAWGPMILTPRIEALGIYYSNSPSHKMQNLGLLGYGLETHWHGSRSFRNKKHIIEPYLFYKALTHPTSTPSEHYIFSIQDGYQKIQQIEGGVRNLLYWNENRFTSNLYANAFFSDPAIPQVIPRLYLDLAWEFPSIYFGVNNCWNFRNHILDYSIARLKWTVDEDTAFSLEARYRSKFDWRKADHENFILDVTRSEEELLLSPLSDRRVTLLSKLFFRPTPFWECQLESHHGFYRIDQKPYNEFKINLYRLINPGLKLKLYYYFTATDPHHHYGFNFQMNK